MNLYAIQPDHSPDPTNLILAESDAQAIDRAPLIAAHDMVDVYGSPTATVYLVAADLPVVGRGHAADLLKEGVAWGGDPGRREELARCVGEWESFVEGCQAVLEKGGDNDGGIRS